MIRIAVVGTGIIGIQHLESIEKSQECTLCAICDVNEVSVTKLAEKYQVPYFTDYRELVKKVRIDAVILNLPHFLHCEVTEFFLDNGVDVLVEKPMANSVKECDRMIAAAKRSGRKLAVGHVMRYNPAIERIKAIYESEEMGKLCMYQEIRSADYFTPKRPKWFLNKELSGGGIARNYGAHSMDSLFYVTGYSSAKVTSVIGNLKNDAEIEGHAQIFLELPQHMSANLTFSGYTFSTWESVWVFTEGVAKISLGELWINKGGEWIKEELQDSPFLEKQLAEFCKLLRGEDSKVATPEQGRAIMVVLEDVYRKAERES